MLPKEERKAMLLRLYNDDSPLIDHNKERNMKPGGFKSEVPVKAVNGEEKSDIESAEPEADADNAENNDGVKTEEVHEADDANGTATDVEMQGSVSV
jgi:multisite-specific tRNA:(cytosine-C5)-methyltransferase